MFFFNVEMLIKAIQLCCLVWFALHVLCFGFMITAVIIDIVPVLSLKILELTEKL